MTSRTGRVTSSGSWLDRVVFAPANPGAVNMFRICLAVMLGWAFLPRGLEPAHFLEAWPSIISIYDTIILTTPYRVVIYLLLLCFLLGFRPRLMGLVLCCLLIPLDVMNEGRQSRQVLIFTLVCTSLLCRKASWPADRSSSADISPMWPVRLIQLQSTVLYGINAIYKSTPQFLDGEVLMGLSRDSNFLVDITADGLVFGPMTVPGWVLGIGTVVTEYWLAIGFWIPRLRWATAIFGVAFHVTLTLVIEIFMLDYVSMFLYLAFLLPFSMERLQRNGAQHHPPPVPRAAFGSGARGDRLEQHGQLSPLKHLPDDVASTDKFTINVKLRNRRPVGELLEPLPHLRIFQDIEGPVLDLEVLEDLNDRCRESAHRKQFVPLHEEENPLS